MRVESDYYSEPEEIRERCLNCTLPANYCEGEENCLAQNRMRTVVGRKALRDTVRYGLKKGKTQAQIAREIYVRPQYVSAVAKQLKAEGAI